MDEKVKMSFSIPMYTDFRAIPIEIDSAEFKAELIEKLKKVGIENIQFETENILIGLSVYEGQAVIVECSRGMDMVALRIFMSLIVKYNSVLQKNYYYTYKWGDIFASLSVHSDNWK